MNELAKRLGELATNAIIGAIQAGKSRREAQDAGAEAIRREDVVSDELWDDLDRYIDKTKDFEENGAG